MLHGISGLVFPALIAQDQYCLPIISKLPLCISESPYLITKQDFILIVSIQCVSGTWLTRKFAKQWCISWTPYAKLKCQHHFCSNDCNHRLQLLGGVTLTFKHHKIWHAARCFKHSSSNIMLIVSLRLKTLNKRMHLSKI